MKAFVVLFSLFFLGVALAGNPVATHHQFDSHIGEMKYLDSKNVLILSSGRLFRSTNGGKDWQRIDLPKISGYAESSTSPESIHTSRDGKNVFLRGNKQSCWVSSDSAKSWTAVKTNGHWETVEWHSLESGWAIATTSKDNHATYEIYATLNYGQAWAKVAENIIMSEAYWGDAGMGSVPSSRIYFIQERSPGELTHFHLCYTEDWGKSQIVVNKQTITAVFRPNHIFVLSYSDDYSEVYLRVSPDVGIRNDKVFMRAEFPWGEELENSLYSIEDDTYKNVWMGVNHGHSRSAWGHLYHSDTMGVQYSLSVPFVYFAWPLFDFHRIQGTDGVYMVNTIEDPDDEWDHRIQTWITHDQGRNWAYIEPPKSHQWKCSGDVSHCALHIHGWSGHWTGSFGPFYSTRNAPGIVLGNGNVGEHLSLDAETHTFISSDGGNTWKMILEFPSIYEISNHGGIIVFAELATITDKVHYTTDYGATVQELNLGVHVEVRNIVAEPGLKGTQFILEDFDGETVVHLDFEPLMGTVCTSRDYEDYKPVNPNTQYHHGNECLMGSATVMKRRKPNNKCKIPDNFDVTRSTSKACECTDWDYICDYGYYHASTDPDTGDKYCHRDATVDLHDPPLWCVPGRKYYVSDGYVKEPGNTCEGGVQHKSEEKSCPGTRLEDGDAKTGSSSKAGWVAVGVIVPLVALILVGAYFAMNNEGLRDRFPVLQSLFDLKEGYSRMGQPGNQPGALFDDEEYIIGSLDDKNDEEETGELKTVDLNSTAAHSEALNADLEEFNPRK